MFEALFFTPNTLQFPFYNNAIKRLKLIFLIDGFFCFSIIAFPVKEHGGGGPGTRFIRNLPERL